MYRYIFNTKYVHSNLLVFHNNNTQTQALILYLNLNLLAMKHYDLRQNRTSSICDLTRRDATQRNVMGLDAFGVNSFFQNPIGISVKLGW